MKVLTLTAACLQLGDKPPYRLINIPVRTENGVPQVCVDGTWLDFPQGGPRPKVYRYHGMTVAGISSNWAYLNPTP